MRKFLFGMFICLVLTVVMITFASADPLTFKNLPAEISTLLPAGGASAVEGASLLGTGQSDYWFVLTEDASRVLYCFRNTGKGWKEYFHTSKAVPQGKNYLEISMLEEGADDIANGRHYKGPVLAMWLLDSQYPDQSEKTLMGAYYRLSGQNWSIIRYWNQETGTSTLFADDSITYYKNPQSGTQAGTAFGTIQRNLRYISISSTIPKTFAEAEKGLTFAPVLPAGSDLHASEIEFTGGKKYEVYSGPGKNTIRGGNGKASVSTNGWIQVFGQDNGWLMIQYSIDNAHYRIGYIDAAALPKNTQVGYLNFSAKAVSVQDTCDVTDDPLYSRSVLARLNKGDNVVWLASMGDWAYIEGPNFRGFVPASSVVPPDTGNGSSTDFYVYKSANGLSYDMFEIRKMHYDASHGVYAVSGVFEKVAYDDEIPYGETAEGGRLFTFNLSPGFSARMIADNYSEMKETVVSDLYGWYVAAYMEGKAPQGDMTFLYDLPEKDRAEAEVDFWFVTTKIRLNNLNEIDYMEYIYVPWG